jgi:hypothetical protein
MKIGITFDVPDSPMSMFSNGIRQNAFYLTELLVNIGYDVELIILSNFDKISNVYGYDSARYKCVDFKEILERNYDVVIQFAFQLPTNVAVQLKMNGVKLVAYNCGNSYLITLEETVFSKKHGYGQQHVYFAPYGKVFDEIWSIPQMVNTNLYYWKTLYRCDVKEVPFIWSNIAVNQLESEMKKEGGTLQCVNRGPEKKLGIFEPNMNTFKWFWPALLVCENSYRISPEKIKHVYVTNILDKKEKLNMDLINNLVKALDLKRDSKISIEARWNTLQFMADHCDVAVSHQWENPLNYLYLDLAWMGWPIIHNAHLCKDIGYYYDGFNYEEGGKVLSDVINNHDKDIPGYMQRNRELIDRYLPTNKKLQEKYIKLFDQLMKKKKKK